MFTTDSEIFQHIGEVLHKSVEGKWIKIEVEFERTEGSIGCHGKFISYSGEKKYPNGRYILNNTSDALEELYQMMTAKSDKHKWNKAKVTLTNEGDFNIKFDWDQEMYDEIERLNNEYDPRWDDTLTKEEKIEAYEKMKDTMYQDDK